MGAQQIGKKPSLETILNAKARPPRVGMRRLMSGIAGLSVTLALCGCVGSEKPLLTESKPVVGPHFSAQLFRKFSDGKSHEMRTTAFTWQDGAYVNTGSGAAHIARFVVQPLRDEDSIIQSSDTGQNLFRYWIGRKLTDGAYLIFPLDEADVDDTARTASCAKGQPDGVCIVDNASQLITLARATASKPVKNAEIAVIVQDGLSAAAEGAVVR